ncbi:hypothetical protein N7492_003569 [Penicillium capsulatum]|uniref:RRM domain-containing protein n=1 Tax=Penicillium capsulatum TaxID=69766 RepID=A0A9W9IJU5_9EURO|nr:hypothetical protein N7492_003569 [Penicillium capsulatum]
MSGPSASRQRDVARGRRSGDDEMPNDGPEAFQPALPTTTAQVPNVRDFDLLVGPQDRVRNWQIAHEGWPGFMQAPPMTQNFMESIDQRLQHGTSRGMPVFPPDHSYYAPSSVSSESRVETPNPYALHGYTPNPLSANSTLVQRTNNPYSLNPNPVSVASTLRSSLPNHPGLQNVVGTSVGSTGVFQPSPLQALFAPQARQMQPLSSMYPTFEAGYSSVSRASSHIAPSSQMSTSPPPSSDSARAWVPSSEGSIMAHVRDLHRWFRVTNVPIFTPIGRFLFYLQKCNTTDGPFLNAVTTTGTFYVGFSDSRDGRKLMEHLESEEPSWKITEINRETFRANTALVTNPPKGFEDCVSVRVYAGPGSRLTTDNVASAVEGVLRFVGPVHKIEEKNIDDAPGTRLKVHEVKVKFYDARHAMNAAKSVSGFQNEDMLLEVMPWHEKAGHWTWSKTAPAKRRGGKPASPEAAARPEGGEKTADIDEAEILSGRETRTTLMVKGMPPTMPWTELKQLLDAVVFGRYNHLYLRKNFETSEKLLAIAQYSVGYSFVNFEDSKALLEFVQNYQGKKWPGWEDRSDAPASFSFAREQGFEKLIEFHRNSPVMLSRPDERPKVFSMEGPKRGEELAFPAVNNFVALTKLIERGKSSLLFSPRSGGVSTQRRKKNNRRGPEDGRTPSKTKGVQVKVEPEEETEGKTPRANPQPVTDDSHLFTPHGARTYSAVLEGRFPPEGN